MIRTTIRERGLIRLIPATYHKPPTLRALVDSDEEMEILAKIEGLTSLRQMAEKGQNMHVDKRELAWQRRNNDLKVYGNSHVNAAFTYTRTTGNRFNSSSRGAWYCAWEMRTSMEEVAYHKTRELSYIGIYEDKTRYVELLADFIGDFPDISDQPDHPCLSPDPALGYPEGQKLALDLQKQGERGLIYPSVRSPGGRCLVIFDPSAIQNVRPGAKWELIWSGSPEFSLENV